MYHTLLALSIVNNNEMATTLSMHLHAFNRDDIICETKFKMIAHFRALKGGCLLERWALIRGGLI